jgi:hypothetical protein
VPTSGDAKSSMNAARSRASDSRSTSRSVLIGAGGQATGPSPVMAGNLSQAQPADPQAERSVRLSTSREPYTSLAVSVNELQPATSSPWLTADARIGRPRPCQTRARSCGQPRRMAGTEPPVSQAPCRSAAVSAKQPLTRNHSGGRHTPEAVVTYWLLVRSVAENLRGHGDQQVSHIARWQSLEQFLFKRQRAVALDRQLL